MKINVILTQDHTSLFSENTTSLIADFTTLLFSGNNCYQKTNMHRFRKIVM